MGGYGSTRWEFHTKKNTVEDCRVISIFDLKREGVLQQDARCWGSWVWRNAYSGKCTASLGYELNTLSSNAYFRVYYTITQWDGNKRDFDYRIWLSTTPCHFGGVRWWFKCPLLTNGRHCGRRTAKVYLPPGGRYYGCRLCYDLTYRSSQTCDKRINALRKLGPSAILLGINSGEIDLIKGLKALPDEVWQRL